MPLVDCSRDAAWEDYVRATPGLSRFRNLRPSSGVHALPAYREPPPGARTRVVLAGGPAEEVAEALARDPRGRPYLFECRAATDNWGVIFGSTSAEDAPRVKDAVVKIAGIVALVEFFSERPVVAFYLRNFAEPEPGFDDAYMLGLECPRFPIRVLDEPGLSVETLRDYIFEHLSGQMK